MHMWIVASISVLALMSALSAAAAECRYTLWKSYQSTALLQHETVSAYLFTSQHMAVDADGSPNAYHPDDIGLDFLANAGYPNSSWWRDVLVPDPHNQDKAYTQTSGEFVGYFISKTSLQDSSRAETDTRRYVDARTIPYLVFPGSFYRMHGTGQLGDLGYAINLATGEASAFVVADIGPFQAKLTEVSIALAEGLGGQNVNPRNGAGVPQGEMLYIVFPYSSRNHAWPLRAAEIEHFARHLLEEAGGVDAALSCMQNQ